MIGILIEPGIVPVACSSPGSRVSTKIVSGGGLAMCACIWDNLVWIETATSGHSRLQKSKSCWLLVLLGSKFDTERPL